MMPNHIQHSSQVVGYHNQLHLLHHIAPIAQLVSTLDLATSSVQVEGSILTAGKRLSLKNLNVIIRAIN